MRMPSAVAAGSAAIAVLVGGFAVAHGVHHAGSKTAQPQRQARVLGQVIAREPETSTPTTPTTSRATAGPQGAPAIAQAPTATPPTTVAPAAKAPSTTAVPVRAGTGGACGTGAAQASLQSGTVPRQPPDNGYDTDVAVTVDNHVDKAIQIDTLSARLFFADGSSQVFSFNQAVGSVLSPGQSARFAATFRTAAPPSQVQLNSFGFHTAGRPQCVGRAA